MAVPSTGTINVVRSVPAVRTAPGGNVSSTISVTTAPARTCVSYSPFVSVVTVSTVPKLSTMTMLTFSIPRSRLSCWPFPFQSLKTMPFTFPNGVTVGDSEGDSVGESVGDVVGVNVGKLVGAFVGEAEAATVGKLVGEVVGEDVGKAVGGSVCRLGGP